MSFRLALVGHGSSIREIQEIVAETFENIETVGIEMPSDERVDEAAQALRRCLPELDGVLYTRSEPYKLMVSRVDHGAVLARYVNVDAASFVHALLIAQSKYHADIYRVSVDTLDYVTVMKTYRSLELDMDHVQPVSISVDTNAAHFVDATAKTHRESYRSGLCSVCITNIRNVQDTLAAEGIPCVLMAPSPDNYISEVRRLILSWHAKEKAKEGSVIIRIHAELSGDYYLNRKTMVQSVLDLAKLAEQIVLFAQLVSGAYLRMGEQDFAVICSYEVLSDTTDRFSHFDLLAQVYGGTPYRLAVGIGTGLHFQQALANAELGTQRAWEEGSNRAYLVYAEDRFVGPIQPNELMHVKRSQFDPQLLKVAQDCALSNNTVLKISTFVQRKNNGTFFTAELAEELHISFRTAARIVEKLEQNGYIVEVGRSVLNGRGRPASFSCCAEFHAENQFQRYDPTQCVFTAMLQNSGSYTPRKSLDPSGLSGWFFGMDARTAERIVILSSPPLFLFSPDPMVLFSAAKTIAARPVRPCVFLCSLRRNFCAVLCPAYLSA